MTKRSKYDDAVVEQEVRTENEYTKYQTKDFLFSLLIAGSLSVYNYASNHESNSIDGTIEV